MVELILWGKDSVKDGLFYKQKLLQQFPPREDWELLYLLKGEDSQKNGSWNFRERFGPANAFRLLAPLKGEIETVVIPLTSTKGRVAGKRESHCLPHRDPSLYELRAPRHS